MSRFLGPIHHWLYNKIKLYEELETEIIKNIEGELNTNLKELVEELTGKIGEPIPDKPLEELIDTNNIHGWLQGRINIAETRQAALITELINRFQDKALDVIKKTYEEQGRNCGKDAAYNYDVSTAQLLYKALNNYILDGMPCDNVNNITLNEEDRLQWKVHKCLHKGYWINVGGDTNVLYELRKIWTISFIENANSSFEYRFFIDDKEKILVHEIIKK